MNDSFVEQQQQHQEIDHDNHHQNLLLQSSGDADTFLSLSTIEPSAISGDGLPSVSFVNDNCNDDDNIDHEKDFSTLSTSTPTNATINIPPSIQDLALDSASKRIIRLERELKKIEGDRQHWRSLAKQASGIYSLFNLFMVYLDFGSFSILKFCIFGMHRRMILVLF